MKTITIDYDEYKQIIKDKERAEATTEELLNLAKGEVIEALEDKIIVLADSNEELKQKLDQLKDEIETIPLVKPRRGWWT